MDNVLEKEGAQRSLRLDWSSSLREFGVYVSGRDGQEVRRGRVEEEAPGSLFIRGKNVQPCDSGNAASEYGGFETEGLRHRTEDR